jgi:hypothetical protein
MRWNWPDGKNMGGSSYLPAQVPQVFSICHPAFIVPNNPRTDLRAEDVAALELSPDQKAGFFAIPENRSLIADISRKFPGGKSGLIYRRPKPDEILFEYYIIEP